MQITVSNQTNGLHNGPEVWIRVLSEKVEDLSRVEAAMTKDQRTQLNAINPRMLLQYFPHIVTPEEKADHGFSFEDWWVFGPVRQKAGA